MPKFEKEKPKPGPYSRPSRSTNQFVDNMAPNRSQPNDGVERPPWYHSSGSTDDQVREAVEWLLANRAPHMVQNTGGQMQFRCCYCRQFFDPSLLQIEHIVPFSTIAANHAFTQSEYALVTNDIANLTYACGNTGGNGCNQSKRDRDPIEFLGSITTSNLAQFLLDTPWAAWMSNGVSMNYMPPWNNAHRTPVPCAAYNQAEARFLNNRQGDSTPRPPLSGESCLVDRNHGIIAAERCVNYLRTQNRIPAWLTNQVIKNVLDEHGAGQFKKQYTPENYSNTLSVTLGFPSPFIELYLLAVTCWPRR